MKRKLLNQIFSKYPYIKNIELLFDLNELELVKILNSEDSKEAQLNLNQILLEKSVSEEKQQVLSLEPKYYINF